MAPVAPIRYAPVQYTKQILLKALLIDYFVVTRQETVMWIMWLAAILTTTTKKRPIQKKLLQTNCTPSAQALLKCRQTKLVTKLETRWWAQCRAAGKDPGISLRSLLKGDRMSDLNSTSGQTHILKLLLMLFWVCCMCNCVCWHIIQKIKRW